MIYSTSTSTTTATLWQRSSSGDRVNTARIWMVATKAARAAATELSLPYTDKADNDEAVR